MPSQTSLAPASPRFAPLDVRNARPNLTFRATLHRLLFAAWGEDAASLGRAEGAPEPPPAAEDPSEARTSAFVVSIRSCGGATCARAAMPRAPGEDPERDAPERGGREGASPEDGTDDIGPAGARRGEAGRGQARPGEARRGDATRGEAHPSA